MHFSCCLAHPSSFIYLMRKLSTLFLHVISLAIFSFKFFCSYWLEQKKKQQQQHECLLEKPQLKCTLWFTTTINWNCVFFLLFFCVTIFFRMLFAHSFCILFSSSKWFFLSKWSHVFSLLSNKYFDLFINIYQVSSNCDVIAQKIMCWSCLSL